MRIENAPQLPQVAAGAVAANRQSGIVDRASVGAVGNPLNDRSCVVDGGRELGFRPHVVVDGEDYSVAVWLARGDRNGAPGSGALDRLRRWCAIV